ncbi:MAG: GntR family transcriptional regulator [Desulfobacula sp.]|nr:GntR family transcriptional regulator [Desulfobacula sp.]
MTKIQKNKKSNSDHTQIAYDGIRQLLFINEIVAGQKISYRMVAEKLGMSLTPVIQALKILEFQGLVRHTPNKGYHTEPLNLQEIEEIYELREVVEISLLPKVINNLDSESIHHLKNIVEKINSDEIDLNNRLIVDRDFHITLASISRCKIQLQILQNLFDLLYLKYRGSILFIASEKIVGSQHQTIFDAVLTRDIDKAADAMKKHFMIVKTKALSTLSQLLAGYDVPKI